MFVGMSPLHSTTPQKKVQNTTETNPTCFVMGVWTSKSNHFNAFRSGPLTFPHLPCIWTHTVCMVILLELKGARNPYRAVGAKSLVEVNF